MPDKIDVQLARLEEKVDHISERIGKHDAWERSNKSDQEVRIRSLEKHRNVLWGVWVGIAALFKYGPHGIIK